MDENILTNESREESDSQNKATPNGVKNLNTNSINAINSAGFSNHQAMKKMKGSSKMISKNNQSSISKGVSSTHGMNMHVRPKTQINGQRSSAARNIDSRINTSMGMNPNTLDGG